MNKDWEVKKLGEVASLSGRIGWKGLTAKEYTKEGPLFVSVHSLNYGDYVDLRDAFHISQERYDESPEIMLQKDDILICKDGAGIGKLGIVGDLSNEATINSSLLLIRRKDVILTKYLYFSLLSPFFQSIINSKLMGATTPHLYQRDITNFPIYLPSFSEQQHIVAILDETLAAIAKAKENAEKNLQNSRELFESFLQSVFANSEEVWTELPLSSIANVISGFSFKSGDFSDDNEVKSVKITNVGVNKFIEDSQNNLPAEYKSRHKNYLVYEGDIVIALTRTIISDGLKVAIVPPSYHLSLINQRVAAIRADSNKVIAPFLYMYLCTDRVVNYVLKSVNTLMQPNLSIKDLLSLPIPLPSLSQQCSIVAKLDALSTETKRLEEIYLQKLASLDELKKSMLQKAFNGELTGA
ncbi:MAG: restriction endonuclease subunit S [Methanosarcina sp.]